MRQPNWRLAVAAGLFALVTVAGCGWVWVATLTSPEANRRGAAVSRWGSEEPELLTSSSPGLAATSAVTRTAGAGTLGVASPIAPLGVPSPAPTVLTITPSLLIPADATPLTSVAVAPVVTSPVDAPATPAAVGTIASIPTSLPIPTLTPGAPAPPALDLGTSALPPGQPAPPADLPQVAPPAVANTGSPVQQAGAEIRVPTRTGPIPRSLQISDINLSAQIVPVGLEPSGILASPPGPDIVGWYAGGPRAGQPGNLLLDGHRDWQEGPRPAVFWSLDRLVPNRTQLVIWSDTEGYVYLVTENFRLHRDDPRGLTVLAKTSDPTVTLITCEGRFEAARREYDDRRVVRGRLIGTLAR